MPIAHLSELFGHVKGAFTGALANRDGRFALADSGTIFLDEVGELPPDTQVKLLRVLQEQEFEPIGSSKTIKVDVRVIAATNRDLSLMVREGKFRSDLFYRLNVFPVTIPPLRERQEDVPLLTMFFLEKFARKLGRPIAHVAEETMSRLCAYSWPGNIRELQRCDPYNNQNKKEGYPDSIGTVYLIVGSRAEEQLCQASCTLVRHERQPLINFSQDFANQPAGSCDPRPAHG